MKFGILEIRVKIFEEDEVFERVDRELHLPNKKINVVGPLPKAFLLVTTDYFTKQIEEKQHKVAIQLQQCKPQTVTRKYCNITHHPHAISLELLSTPQT